MAGNGPGRPKANIDWDKVDQYLIAGCSGAEVAGNLGLEKQSIYKYCEEEKGMTFTQYKQLKRAKGDSLLRAAQFKNAMDGNTTMQVWLGKQRLDQRDKPEESQIHNHYYFDHDPTKREGDSNPA